MRFIPLTQENLIDLRVFLHKVKGDFLATKERGKSNPLEEYVTRGRFRMILAIQGDFVAGYVAYDTMYHKSSKIIGIAVLPDLRGKGVGSELLQRAIMDLKGRGLKSTMTKTWESNAASIALLQKSGFKKYKTVKDDRVNGESTLWFKCKLQ
jgi:ribosomal protein S18 acetylase RimI-like enzyme